MILYDIPNQKEIMHFDPRKPDPVIEWLRTNADYVSKVGLGNIGAKSIKVRRGKRYYSMLPIYFAVDL